MQDSSPERRNLMVTSLGFIAYYFGGGAVLDHEVRIQVVNVSFSRPMVLAVIAWGALFWFLLRYWQTHKRKYARQLLEELREFKDSPFVIGFLEKKLGKKWEVEGGFRSDTPWKYEEGYGVSYKEISNTTYSENGRLKSYDVNGSGIIYFTGVYGSLVLWRILASSAFRNRAFTEYLVPYMLFLAAIMGAILSVAL